MIARAMKHVMMIITLLGAVSGQVNAESNTHPNFELVSSYILGPGDKIQVQVYHEPDLTIEARLSDASTIMFPFLGEISAAGLTIGQLKVKITEALNTLLVEPMVSVEVTEYRPFFVNGEVQKPGGYPYLPGLTVQKAVSIAGGFTERASRSKAKLVQEKAPNHKEIGVGMNTPVAPGDVVIIEESFF
jgi:polysaccharide export outer membrane protein